MMSDLRKFWSQRQESNPQPTDYKSVALPLSHTGEVFRGRAAASASRAFARTRERSLYDNKLV